MKNYAIQENNNDYQFNASMVNIFLLLRFLRLSGMFRII